MRPIWWDFDDEKALAAEETTFMFGPDYFVSKIIAHSRAHHVESQRQRVPYGSISLTLRACHTLAQIAPVLAPNVTALDVYFPEGASFTHFYTQVVYTGGTKASVPTPFDQLAIFKVHRSV